MISQRWYRYTGFIHKMCEKIAGEEKLWAASLHDNKNDNVANSCLWSTNKSASFTDAAVSNVQLLTPLLMFVLFFGFFWGGGLHFNCDFQQKKDFYLFAQLFLHHKSNATVFIQP